MVSLLLKKIISSIFVKRWLGKKKEFRLFIIYGYFVRECEISKMCRSSFVWRRLTSSRPTQPGMRQRGWRNAEGWLNSTWSATPWTRSPTRRSWCGWLVCRMYSPISCLECRRSTSRAWSLIREYSSRGVWWVRWREPAAGCKQGVGRGQLGWCRGQLYLYCPFLIFSSPHSSWPV